MIIHTKNILKNIGLKFIDKEKDISNFLKSEEKLKILLSYGKKTTNEIYKELNLSPRAIRKCLLKMENKKEVKRIKGKEINKKVRYSDSWILKTKKIIKRVPQNKIFAHYRNEHYNKGYRQHYMFFPKSININEDHISAIGFFDAEGSKTKPKSTEVVNSEPSLIRLFIKFLDYFNIKKENLSYRIIFNNKLPYLLKITKKEINNNAIKFWSSQVKIPINKDIKLSYVGKLKGKSRKRVIKYGSLNINYNNVLFRKFLFNLIKTVKSQVKTEKESVSYLRGYFAGEAYVGAYDKQIQVGSKDKSQLIFCKTLLEKIGVRSSICNETSTCPPRLLISDLKSFIILESKNLFKFHQDKKRNLIKKILNYRSVDNALRKKLERKLKKLK